MQASDTTVVRPFAPPDARFIHAMADEAFGEYSGVGVREHTLAMALNPIARTLVAERDGRPVGFAVVMVDGERAHLSAIAVAPGVRGRGIGWTLLRAAERNAAARGAAVIRLETGEANLAAIELFVRAGYERAGRIARYYRTGYDALTYRKALDPRGR